VLLLRLVLLRRVLLLLSCWSVWRWQVRDKHACAVIIPTNS
jgi:hypothetical protein